MGEVRRTNHRCDFRWLVLLNIGQVGPPDMLPKSQKIGVMWLVRMSSSLGLRPSQLLAPVSLGCAVFKVSTIAVSSDSLVSLVDKRIMLTRLPLLEGFW